jgi:hypothetical protein
MSERKPTLRNRQGRKPDGQCTFCRPFRAHLDGCPSLQDDPSQLHATDCPVALDNDALCRCHVIEYAFSGAHS